MDTPVFCIVGASGTGKTTIVNHLVDEYDRVGVLVSHTTREKREGEVHGRDYYFVNNEDFVKKTKLEKVEYAGNKYCLSYSEVMDKLASEEYGVLLVITDYHGLEQLNLLFNNYQTHQGNYFKGNYFTDHKLYSVYFKTTKWKLLGRLIKRDGLKGLKRFWHALRTGEFRSKKEQEDFDIVLNTGMLGVEATGVIFISKILHKLGEDFDG